MENKTNRMRIDGFLFYRTQLEILTLIHKESSDKLTASAIAALLMLQKEADVTGRVYYDKKRVGNFSKLTGIATSTIYDGLHTLEELSLITAKTELLEFDTHTNEPYTVTKHYYQIIHYQDFDTADEKTYFYVPNKIFLNESLKSLVSSREVDGILFMLSLSMRLTISYGMRQSTKLEYNHQTLLTLLQSYRTKVKRTVQVLQAIFTVEKRKGIYSNSKVRESKRKKHLIHEEDLLPEDKKDNRYRKYIITLNTSLLKEKEESPFSYLIPKLERKILNTFATYKKELSKKDWFTIRKIIQKNILPYLECTDAPKYHIDKMISKYFGEVIHQMLDYQKTHAIFSIPAYFTNSLKVTFVEHIKKELGHTAYLHALQTFIMRHDRKPVFLP